MNPLFLYDQLISWACVMVCWWITQQTAHAPWRNLSTGLMRIGVASFGFMLAIVTGMRSTGIFTPWAGEVFKSSLLILFLGIAIFHTKRFGKL